MNSHNTPDTDLVRDFTAVFGESKAPQQNLEAIAMRMQAVKSMMAIVADMESKKHGLLQERAQELKSLLSEIANVNKSIQAAESDLERLQNPEKTYSEISVLDESGRKHQHQVKYFAWIDSNGQQTSPGTITACSVNCDAVGRLDKAVSDAQDHLATIEDNPSWMSEGSFIEANILFFKRLRHALVEFPVKCVRIVRDEYEKIDKRGFDDFCVSNDDADFWVSGNEIRELKQNPYTSIRCFIFRIKNRDQNELAEEMLKLAIGNVDCQLNLAVQQRARYQNAKRWLNHLRGVRDAEASMAAKVDLKQIYLYNLKIKLSGLESNLQLFQENPPEVLEELNRTIEKYRTDVQALIGSSQMAGAPETAAE